MDIAAYRDEIKLKLTGNLLELELDDATIDKVINSALREIQRYICSVEVMTIPFSQCIDLSNPTYTNNIPIKVSAVTNIYRASSYGTNSYTNGISMQDPMYGSYWQVLSPNGNLYGYQDYAYNYMSWNTLLQTRNTISTDLAFYFDKKTSKLYINAAGNMPSTITIEYIPRFDTVDDVVSDYWIDFLIRLAVALTKITVGRIRSRYTQTNALWTQDGERLLEEGNAELTELRTYLATNNQLLYPID